MFGMSFTEILLILIIAVIFVGPDKLPKVAVDIAKIFRRFKGAVNEAKSAIDEELSVTELKQEAQKYRAQIEQGSTKVRAGMSEIVDLDLDMNDLLDDDEDNKDDENTKNKNTKSTIKQEIPQNREKLAYKEEDTQTTKEEA